MQGSGVLKANLLVDGVNAEEDDSYAYLGKDVNMHCNP